MNSKFIYLLVENHDEYGLLASLTRYRVERLVRIYDHNLKNCRVLNKIDFKITSLIKSIKAIDNGLIILDSLSYITIIKTNGKEYFTKFKLNGDRFSLYNEFFIIAYDPSSELVWYHYLNGTKVNYDKLANKINPIVFKGGKKKYYSMIKIQKTFISSYFIL